MHNYKVLDKWLKRFHLIAWKSFLIIKLIVCVCLFVETKMLQKWAYFEFQRDKYLMGLTHLSRYFL